MGGLAAALLLAFAAITLAVGCGKKKPPRPVAPKVPKPVSGLGYTLREAVVRLSFRMPESYEDKSPLQGGDRIAILRAEVPFADRDCPDCPRQYEEILGVTLDYTRGLAREGDRALYTDTDVKPGVRYLYEVVVEGEGTGVSVSPETLVVDVVEPPAAISSISGKYRAREVSLFWDEVASPERKVFYSIYRREKEKGDFARLNKKPVAQNSYVDETALPEKVYTYTVRALHRERGTESESGVSKSISAGPIPYPRPPAPEGFVAIPREGRVELKWEPVKAEGLRGYRIHREGIAEGQIVLTEELVTDTVYIDTGVKKGAVYGYAVTAVAGKDPESESNYSKWRDVFLP